jgi:hypothetical protein
MESWEDSYESDKIKPAELTTSGDQESDIDTDMMPEWTALPDCSSESENPMRPDSDLSLDLEY